MKKRLLKICSILFVTLMIFQNLFIATFADRSKIDQETRGIWISFLDLKPLVYQKTEFEFTKNIDKVFDNINSINLTDVFVQVRPFSDALYRSTIFPQSDILTGTQGQDCGYDPLKIMVNKAHEKKLKIHAWVNPYRIKNPGSELTLSTNHPATKWLKEGNTNEIISLPNGGVYFNPCSLNVINLTVNGVKEIIQNYNVDGIHFDDYFYPTTDTQIDSSIYNNYKTKGGTLSLEDWRMENVNRLVKETHKEIKKTNPNISFGISPSGSIKDNYFKLYSDVKKWLSQPGYVDYLCPQIYYGFKNESLPFKNTLNEWTSLPKLDTVKLYVGLAAYKINIVDVWAGSGSNEWINDNNIISNQILACRSNSKCDGFCLFRYDSLFNPQTTNREAVEIEMSHIRKVLSY